MDVKIGCCLLASMSWLKFPFLLPLRSFALKLESSTHPDLKKKKCLPTFFFDFYLNPQPVPYHVSYNLLFSHSLTFRGLCISVHFNI